MSTDRNYVRRRESIPLDLPADVMSLIFGMIDELAQKESINGIQFGDADGDLSLTQRQFILFLTRRFKDFDIVNFLFRRGPSRFTWIDEERLLDYLSTKYDYIKIGPNIATYEFKSGKTNKVLILDDNYYNLEDIRINYYSEIDGFLAWDERIKNIYVDFCWFNSDIGTGSTEIYTTLNSERQYLYIYAPNLTTFWNCRFKCTDVILDAPILKNIGDDDMYQDSTTNLEIRAPYLKTIGSSFLSIYTNLKNLKIDAPNLESIGAGWMNPYFYFENLVKENPDLNLENLVIETLNLDLENLVMENPDLDLENLVTNILNLDLKNLVMETPKLKEIGEGGYNFLNINGSPRLNSYNSETLPWEKFRALL